MRRGRTGLDRAFGIKRLSALREGRMPSLQIARPKGETPVNLGKAAL